MDHTRNDNIFFKDHMEAFNHAIAKGHLTDNENDTNYAGNYMYMNSENQASEIALYGKHLRTNINVIVDYFKISTLANISKFTTKVWT